MAKCTCGRELEFTGHDDESSIYKPCSCIQTIRINLGSKVQDTVSKFVGVAVAKHLYLNGCTRVTVQPVVDKDGKLPDTATFDEPQLVVIADKMYDGKNDTGGPEKYPDIRKY